MFLATTALSQFWDRDDRIVFLGPWCLRYDRRDERNGLRYEVLSSPWDDRERFYAAAEYLDTFCERLLPALATGLNEVHGVRHGQRYWRILIGPWLLEYLHVLYDRYVHLARVLRRHPGLVTIVLDPRSFTVPYDTAEFTQLVLDDPYNLQLFSQLLRDMGHTFPARALSPAAAMGAARVARRDPRRAWEAAVRRWSGSPYDVVEEGMRRVVGERWQIGLCDVHCSKAMLLSLACRSRLRILRIGTRPSRRLAERAPRWDDRRARLAAVPAGNEFERLVARSLPESFPIVYLEGYQAAREDSRRHLGRSLRAIASATGWFENEPLKFLAAEVSERGTRLVTMQHGGGYGITRLAPMEQHETRIADAFMVWGWAESMKEGGPWKNLPSGRLSSLFACSKRRGRAVPATDILMIGLADFRYLHWFESTGIAIEREAYFEWQLRFLGALPAVLRSRIRYRPYIFDYGSRFAARLGERFPEVQWDHGAPIDRMLAASRLVVLDHCGTTFLEALAANVPIISFWSRRLWELRADAVPYFDGLCRAGVFAESPEAAAARVVETYDDPWAWWGSEAVQAVRRAFSERYALTRKDWVRCWIKALDQEAALTGDGRRTREH